MPMMVYPAYPQDLLGFQPTIHDRDEWVKDPINFPVDRRYVQGRPILPPVRPNKSIWRDGVCHYTAADNLIDGDPGESYDRLDDYLYAIHVSYVRTRGYSIGYNWAVDYLGGIWKLRGWDVINAANAGYNEYSFSILCLVDGADPLNPLMLRSVRWLMMTGEQVSGRALGQRGHREVGQTACPGAGIQTQVSAGLTSPRWYEVTSPPTVPPVATPTTPPISKGDDKMQFIRITDNGQLIDIGYFLVSGSMVEWCSTQGRVDSLSFMKVLDHAGPEMQVPPTPYLVDRGFLQYYTLIGQAPIYPPEYTGPKTSPADFAKWVA